MSINGKGESMDLQHKMAISIAEIIDGKESERREERIMMVYGIEVFLNEFLKIFFSLVIAYFIGIFPLALFSTTYLLMLRRYVGGRHFKSNIVCSIFSFFTIVVAPLLGATLKLSRWIEVLLFIIETRLVIRYTPYLKEGEVTTKEIEKVRKKKAFLVNVIGLILGALFCGEIYMKSGLMIGLIVGCTAIKLKKDNSLIS